MDKILDPDRLLKDALFANIKQGDKIRLYSGVLRDEETQACAAVFFAPKDADRTTILAHLAALPHLAPPAPALPEGWKAVPAMPTDAMIHAAACAHFGKRQVEKTGVRGIDMTANEINYTFLQAFRRFWKGALAAAPEPPAPAADPVKAQLVEALKEIIETGGGAFAGDYHAECIDIARAALAAAEEGR